MSAVQKSQLTTCGDPSDSAQGLDESLLKRESAEDVSSDRHSLVLRDSEVFTSDRSEPTVLHQLMATVVVALTQLEVGATIGFAGVTLPQLTDQSSDDLHFSTLESALFGSMMFVGALLGSLTVSVPMVRLGQRVTLLFSLPISLASWIILATAPTNWVVLLVRFFQGITMSFITSSSSTYVAELSHSSIRGRLMSTLDLSRQMGILVAYALGSSNLTWRKVALTCGFVNTVIPFVCLLYLPNSPRWLATQGYTDRAHKSLIFFRGPNYDVHKEMEDIRDELEKTTNGGGNILDQLRQIRNPLILRYLIIMSVVLFFMHFSGIIVVPTYIVVIINNADISISSYLCAVLIGIIRVVGAFFYVCIIDRIDRKPLFAMTCTVCSLCMIGLGIYFFDQDHDRRFHDQNWLPVVCLAVYSFFSVSPVIGLFRSELFPSSVRSTVVPILYTLFFIGAFTALQSFPYIVLTLGSYGAFWISSGFSVFLAVLVVATVPETRGKTLEEITELQIARSRRSMIKQVLGEENAGSRCSVKCEVST
ncbi:facilitated trehalose transporter Tret1-2 homolog [Cherax quadricarinatus]